MIECSSGIAQSFGSSSSTVPSGDCFDSAAWHCSLEPALAVDHYYRRVNLTGPLPHTGQLSAEVEIIWAL